MLADEGLADLPQDVDDRRRLHDQGLVQKLAVPVLQSQSASRQSTYVTRVEGEGEGGSRGRGGWRGGRCDKSEVRVK